MILVTSESEPKSPLPAPGHVTAWAMFQDIIPGQNGIPSWLTGLALTLRFCIVQAGSSERPRGAPPHPPGFGVASDPP